MRALKTLLVPALFGAALLAIALVTRSGWFARDNPGEPINSAMREAMHRMTLDPADQAAVDQRFPGHEITGTGLRYVIREPGDGVTFPQRGQTVTVHFRGRLLDGTPIDESYADGAPKMFPIGQAQVIPGWDEGIMLMSEGERRTLIVRYWLGYGEKGVTGHIPPKATLVFDIQLLDVE